MNGTMARAIYLKLGRVYRLRKSAIQLTSLSGERLEVEGEVELIVTGVGIVKFQVVKNIHHDIILGWDALHRHGWSLHDNEVITMTWGGQVFPVSHELSPELACVDTGCLRDIIARHKKVFGEPGKLATANLPALTITTDPGQVVWQRPYRAALSKRGLIEDEIDKMLAMGIIQPSNSPWASPVTLVPKKDGTTRFCVDYRALNAVTVKDRYPLPIIQDIFDELRGASMFTTMDMRSGFWQLPVDKDSIAKTAFVCHRGQFEFLRLPFGLANAPSMYQRTMNQVLAPYLGKCVMVFIDDVVVYSKNPADHQRHVDQVLTTLETAGLTLKDSKCTWAQSQIDLLGFVVSKGGISPQSNKTDAIRDLPDPTDLHELRRFLGMTSYYRQLIPNYARHADPLYKLTKKDVSWNWGEREMAAFKNLKSALVSDIIMAHPDTSKPYRLHTDACDHAIGGILCQVDDLGVERPIQYVSAQLSPAQRKYATVEKEAYAVIYCLKKLRCYLLGSEFTVYTDHKPLLCLFTKEMVNTRIQRWAVLMAEYGAKVEYRKGSHNIRADMLSRIKSTDKTEMAVFEAADEWVIPEERNDTIFLPSETDHLDNDRVRAAQEQEWPDELQKAHDKEGDYLLHEGLLYSVARPTNGSAIYPRLMLPLDFRGPIMERCHLESGHSGLYKTLARIQEHYVWPSMRHQVQTVLDRCAPCRLTNARQDQTEMGEMPIAKCPGDIVGLDLQGPHIPSALGANKYLMVLIDHYSGWIEAYPIPNKRNETVWERLRNDYVPRHGAPRVLITDQGHEFRGESFEEWERENYIEHRRTTPYNPQCNGKTERANRTLKDMLTKLVNGNRADWEDRLGPTLTAIRTNVSTVTGFSPFMLHHARPARHCIGRMTQGNVDPSWNERLLLQQEIMQLAAQATSDSREHNRQ
jgi:transposase InsO family protein